jgi:hypothetical protein
MTTCSKPPWIPPRYPNHMRDLRAGVSPPSFPAVSQVSRESDTRYHSSGLPECHCTTQLTFQATNVPASTNPPASELRHYNIWGDGFVVLNAVYIYSSNWLLGGEAGFDFVRMLRSDKPKLAQTLAILIRVVVPTSSSTTEAQRCSYHRNYTAGEKLDRYKLEERTSPNSPSVHSQSTPK